MSNLINISVSKIQGALFPANDIKTMKVYGKESPVIMTGSIRAGDVKEGDGYKPMAYGQLGVRAAKAETREKKEYLHLAIDGGLQGRLNKAEGKEYDYIGSVDCGDGQEFTVFGRKMKATETGHNFISLSSGEKKAKETGNGGNSGNSGSSASAPAAGGNDHDDDIPF